MTRLKGMFDPRKLKRTLELYRRIKALEAQSQRVGVYLREQEVAECTVCHKVETWRNLNDESTQEREFLICGRCRVRREYARAHGMPWP